jgi:hypothetical protein
MSKERSEERLDALETLDGPPARPSAATTAGDGGAFRLSGHEELRQLGRFLLLGRLGQGGMGQVFSAYDPDLDRKVALKLVRDVGASAPEVVARVKLEAMAMAKVSHPNVVHVYESGEAAGRVFIVMEIVDGASLAAWQRSRDLGAPGEVVARLGLYLQAAQGLLAAHRCGLVHRDFKPDNVLVGKDDRVRVADFGLARVLAGLGDAPAGAGAPAEGQRLTLAGTVLGTPGFMSPEQVRGDESDERTDQFSFCVSLYEALYGVEPFPCQTYEVYAQSVLSEAPRPPPPSEVPLVVQQALLRGLSRAPEDRFPSMAELIAALESGLGDAAEPPITWSDKVGLTLGAVGMVVAAVSLNTVAVVLTGTVDNLMRGAIVMAIAFVIIAGLMRWPPRTVRHHDRYQRMLRYIMTFVGYCVVGRLTARELGLAANDYFILECLGYAALQVLEGQRIGARHSALAVPSVACALVMHWRPDLRLVVYNVLLAGSALASIALHTRQPADLAGRDRPSVPPSGRRPRTPPQQPSPSPPPVAGPETAAAPTRR